MTEIKTYDEMNGKICGLLRFNGDNVSLYAAQRITELETENADLSARLENAVKLPCKSWDNVYCLRYTEKGYRIEEKIVKEIAFSNGNMEIRTFCGMFSYEKWTFGDDCFTDYNEAVAHRVKGGKQ